MKPQQYTLSLGVCASCHGNPVLEFDSTWQTFSASLCECKGKSKLHWDDDYNTPLVLETASNCQNCGIDLDMAQFSSPNFGNYCSKGCALETKVYSIRLEMYGPSEEEEDSEEESYDDTFEGMTQDEADEWIELDNEIHGGE